MDRPLRSAGKHSARVGRLLGTVLVSGRAVTRLHESIGRASRCLRPGPHPRSVHTTHFRGRIELQSALDPRRRTHRIRVRAACFRSLRSPCRSECRGCAAPTSDTLRQGTVFDQPGRLGALPSQQPQRKQRHRVHHSRCVGDRGISAPFFGRRRQPCCRLPRRQLPGLRLERVRALRGLYRLLAGVDRSAPGVRGRGRGTALDKRRT